jgi:hypothetical protein
MKAPASVRTPRQYLDGLPKDRREVLSTIHNAIRNEVPCLKPHIAHGMIGYGPFPYRTRRGCERDWFVVGLASQKNYMSLYLGACDSNGYLAERNKDRLGKVSVGRSCIRFKRLEDLDLKVAMQLIRKAFALAKKNGVVSI